MLDFDPALHGAICFYANSCYPRFEELGYDRAKLSAEFCSTWAQEYPLWLRDDKTHEFPRRDIPGFGVRSSVFAMALAAAFLVWAQAKAGDNLAYTYGSPLLDAARDGFTLWQGQKTKLKRYATVAEILARK